MLTPTLPPISVCYIHSFYFVSNPKKNYSKDLKDVTLPSVSSGHLCIAQTCLKIVIVQVSVQFLCFIWPVLFCASQLIIVISPLCNMMMWCNEAKLQKNKNLRYWQIESHFIILTVQIIAFYRCNNTNSCCSVAEGLVY